MMTTLSLRLSESLHKGLQVAAQREGIPINQFVATAVAEKLSALLTEDYLMERAKRGSREAYVAALAKVPDVEPMQEDQISNSAEKTTEPVDRPKQTRRQRRQGTTGRRRPPSAKMDAA